MDGPRRGCCIRTTHTCETARYRLATGRAERRASAAAASPCGADRPARVARSRYRARETRRSADRSAGATVDGLLDRHADDARPGNRACRCGNRRNRSSCRRSIAVSRASKNACVTGSISVSRPRYWREHARIDAVDAVAHRDGDRAIAGGEQRHEVRPGEIAVERTRRSPGAGSARSRSSGGACCDRSRRRCRWRRTSRPGARRATGGARRRGARRRRPRRPAAIGLLAHAAIASARASRIASLQRAGPPRVAHAPVVLRAGREDARADHQAVRQEAHAREREELGDAELGAEPRSFARLLRSRLHDVVGRRARALGSPSSPPSPAHDGGADHEQLDHLAGLQRRVADVPRLRAPRVLLLARRSRRRCRSRRAPRPRPAGARSRARARRRARACTARARRSACAGACSMCGGT